MNSKQTQLAFGFRDGIPIGLGYFAVSFSFGIMAAESGLTHWQAALMSLTNLTSAGQFAALGIITAGAPYGEMAFAQLIINLRYCLMSCSLSQKLDKKASFYHRFLIGYGVTDEVFGVSVCKPGILTPWYCYGLILAAVPGWTLGTLTGAVSGSLLPARAMSPLSVAIYGMFLAIIIPPAKTNRTLAAVIAVSMACSLIFAVVPALHMVSSGIKIIILTVFIAGTAALIFPVTEEKEASHE